MTPNKILEKLLALDGAVTERKNPHQYVIPSPSPSLNFTFGNGWGLPAGYSMVLYGPPKGGKSVICNAMAGQIQRIDPEAWVVKFNTEFREEGQLSDEQQTMWGIDPNRYVAYETNQPDQIFDRIEHEFAALAGQGMKLKLVIIDSVTQIQGRRSMNADTVMTQQIGDNALTIQEGLRRILPVQRKLGFALILTAHVRAQLDPLEQMRGKKFRPAIAFGTQHHCEYSMWVEPNQSAAGKIDELKQTFISEDVQDLAGKGEKLGHKIKIKMMDSSMGPKERSGEFTLDYHRGIINTHEEVFRLGVGWNVIKHPNNQTYSYAGKDYRGKPALLEALKASQELQDAILLDLRAADLAGNLTASAPIAKEEESSED